MTIKIKEDLTDNPDKHIGKDVWVGPDGVATTERPPIIYAWRIWRVVDSNTVEIVEVPGVGGRIIPPEEP